MTNIAILASGSGTNAQRIIEHFRASSLARVVLLLSDNPAAFALVRAQRLGVPTAVFSRAEFAEGTKPLEALLAARADYVVLAGFLRLVPHNIIERFEGRILNIHPALLPKYGGRGMYGERVHEAVIAAGERLSGITIHRVNEQYDDGAIIAQYTVEVTAADTPDTLATKIHTLEHRHFPEVIEQEISKIQNN
jgi:phosphoribosylglycinamide formyltransferase-1